MDSDTKQRRAHAAYAEAVAAEHRAVWERRKAENALAACTAVSHLLIEWRKERALLPLSKAAAASHTFSNGLLARVEPRTGNCWAFNLEKGRHRNSVNVFARPNQPTHIQLGRSFGVNGLRPYYAIGSKGLLISLQIEREFEKLPTS